MKTKLLYLIGLASCLHAGVAAASSGAPAGMAAENKTADAAPAVAVCSIEQHQQIVSAQPENARAHNQLAICLQRHGTFKLALAEYKQAVKIDANYAEAWNNMGTLFHAQQKLGKAVKHYQKALELKPEMATAAKNTGTAYLAMGKVEKAYAAFEQAYKLNPTIFDGTQENGFATPGANLAMQNFYIAKLNALAGRLDVAFEYLAKAQAAGFRDFSKVRSDPAFKAIVADTRFPQLAR
jgi:tetratricopeptide (TPR) repeat protein